MYNIELRNISKRYRNGVVALDDISFNVKNGVFGLLGHNGA
jgi:ABC-2 type transport system ATP-binding protein